MIYQPQRVDRPNFILSPRLVFPTSYYHQGLSCHLPPLTCLEGGVHAPSMFSLGSAFTISSTFFISVIRQFSLFQPGTSGERIGGGRNRNSQIILMWPRICAFDYLIMIQCHNAHRAKQPVDPAPYPPTFSRKILRTCV